MRVLVLVLLVAFATCAQAKLKIVERTDRLTDETSLQASGLMVCQPKDAGMLAKCGQLGLSWSPSRPDSVLVLVTIPDVFSIQKMAVSVDGSVQRFTSPATTAFRVGPASSSNYFVVPAAVLIALCDESNNGIVRVSGTRDVRDFDLRKQAKLKGLPVDELREFLEAIAAYASKE